MNSQMKKQEGVALVVALLLVLAITIPALVIMRTSLMNEKMVASSLDRDAAFQTAEAALVEAEAFVITKPSPPASGCSAGICNTPDPELPPVWEDEEIWSGSLVRKANFGSVSSEAHYIVEYMGVSEGLDQDCTTSGDVSPDASCGTEAFRYRITSRGRTSTGAVVFLQTNYLVP